MNHSREFSINKKHVVLTAFLIALIITGVYLAIRYNLTLDQVRELIEASPLWIFLIALMLLPPLGLPLSIVLVAVGARFGFLYGTLIACAAIFVHHIIAIGVKKLFNTDKPQPPLNKNATFWNKLEDRTGGNTSMLLFLWGVIPGTPYTVKLYLPLAVGAHPVQFIKCSSAGHLIGTVFFVGVGKAMFDGAIEVILAILVLGIILSLGLNLLRNKINKA